MDKISKNLKKKPGKWARAFSRYLDIKIFLAPSALDNVNSHSLTIVVATLRLKTLAVADISSDMTLEIKVIIIFVLTSNRNREKSGKFV